MVDPLDAFRRAWFVDLPDPDPHALDASVWHRTVGGRLWAVGISADLDDPADARLREDPLGFYGSTVGGVGWFLVDDGIRLPESLRHWAVTRDVPAAEIGPGRAAFIEMDGRPLLALSWRYDDVEVYVATVGWAELAAFVPVGETVRLVTTYHR